jgi:hypothetical protein
MELSTRDVCWVVKRLPKSVRDLLKDQAGKVFLAGGFIRSCIANEHVNDIDLFVTNADFAEWMAKVVAPGAYQYKTPNAISVKVGNMQVQFIHKWTFATPQECVASFDFTIAAAAIWFDKQLRWTSVCDNNYYQDLAAKRLVYRAPQRIEEAGGSMLRVLKFYQRGYRIPLDCLGAVIARLVAGIRPEKKGENFSYDDERQTAPILAGLLFEVDPSLDPEHNAHLPSSQEKVESA